MKYFIGQIIEKPPTLPGQKDSTFLTDLFNIIFVTIGALALLFLVIAGMTYVYSQGNPEKVATSKNRIIYALIGLVVAGSALFIVNAVLDRV